MVKNPISINAKDLNVTQQYIKYTYKTMKIWSDKYRRQFRSSLHTSETPTPTSSLSQSGCLTRTSPSFPCLVMLDCTNINHFSENSIRNTNATKIQITSNCNLSQQRYNQRQLQLSLVEIDITNIYDQNLFFHCFT